MAKEGSVAPKERVNIVYKPATGDAQAEVELPLKLTVLGDFTRRQDDRPLEDRDPVSVDKDNFDDVLKAQDVKLDIVVDNKLAELLKLRESLKALKGPLSNIPDFRKKVQEVVKDDAARDQLLEALGLKE